MGAKTRAQGVLFQLSQSQSQLMHVTLSLRASVSPSVGYFPSWAVLRISESSPPCPTCSEPSVHSSLKDEPLGIHSSQHLKYSSLLSCQKIQTKGCQLNRRFPEPGVVFPFPLKTLLFLSKIRMPIVDRVKQTRPNKETRSAPHPPPWSSPQRQSQ